MEDFLEDDAVTDASSSGWNGEHNPLDDPDERRVLLAALDSYRFRARLSMCFVMASQRGMDLPVFAVYEPRLNSQYRKQAHHATTHTRRQNIYALPSDEWKLLASPPFGLLGTLSQIDDAIDTTADLADAILDIGLQSMGIGNSRPANSPQSWHNKAKPQDHFKAHSTIRQFYRDWSAEGFKREVKPILDLILSDLEQHNLPPSTRTTILLPGAGLGRLLFELTLAGYHTTGNEISYHQLLASNFILNHTAHANSYTVYPFLSTFTNNLSRSSQLASFSIPDIHPSTTLATAVSTGRTIGSMSMTAGDFILSYSTTDQAATFDAVIAVFFIDTAPNLIRYIQTVRNVLKPGGLWISVGPLLWHFDNRESEHDHNSDDTSNSRSNAPQPNSNGPNTDINEDTGIAEPGSFELSNDEVLQLVQHFGFKIEKSETLDMQTYGSYIQDPDSMLQSLYRPVHWLARKEG